MASPVFLKILYFLLNLETDVGRYSYTVIIFNRNTTLRKILIDNFERVHNDKHSALFFLLYLFLSSELLGSPDKVTYSFVVIQPC